MLIIFVLCSAFACTSSPKRSSNATHSESDTTSDVASSGSDLVNLGSDTLTIRPDGTRDLGGNGDTSISLEDTAMSDQSLNDTRELDVGSHDFIASDATPAHVFKPANWFQCKAKADCLKVSGCKAGTTCAEPIWCNTDFPGGQCWGCAVHDFFSCSLIAFSGGDGLDCNTQGITHGVCMPQADPKYGCPPWLNKVGTDCRPKRCKTKLECGSYHVCDEGFCRDPS